MPDLEEQLRGYGSYLDGLDDLDFRDADVQEVKVPRRGRVRLVAAAVLAVALVAGSVAVAVRHDSKRQVSILGNTAPAASTPSREAQHAVSDIVHAHPTFAQQVAQLEAWYRDAVADAPGGRPILLSEFEVCDYRAAPALGSNAQIRFASYFPLGEQLDEARLVDGCLERDDSSSASSPHQLCSAVRRGPVYDDATPVAKLDTKPIVVFGNTDCAAAGYAPFAPNLLGELNDRRRVEIEMWAVPRRCPTEQDATQWVEKVSAQELGAAWTVAGPQAVAASETPGTVTPGTVTPGTVTPGTGSPTANNCVRPERIDWDLHRVTLERF